MDAFVGNPPGLYKGQNPDVTLFQVQWWIETVFIDITNMTVNGVGRWSMQVRAELDRYTDPTSGLTTPVFLNVYGPVVYPYSVLWRYA
jgi:hypothetical protein